MFQQSDSQGETTCVFSIRISSFLPGKGVTRFHSLRMIFKVSEPGVLEFEPGLSQAHSRHICLALRTSNVGSYEEKKTTKGAVTIFHF